MPFEFNSNTLVYVGVNNFNLIFLSGDINLPIDPTDKLNNVIVYGQYENEARAVIELICIISGTARGCGDCDV